MSVLTVISSWSGWPRCAMRTTSTAPRRPAQQSCTRSPSAESPSPGANRSASSSKASSQRSGRCWGKTAAAPRRRTAAENWAKCVPFISLQGLWWQRSCARAGTGILPGCAVDGAPSAVPGAAPCPCRREHSIGHACPASAIPHTSSVSHSSRDFLSPSLSFVRLTWVPVMRHGRHLVWTQPASHHPLVWLKYCVASNGLSMIGAEQSTEAFAPHHTTRLTTHCSLRRDKPVVEALVIAFCMIVGQVLVDRMMQGAFPQHDHPFQGLFLDRAYEP